MTDINSLNLEGRVVVLSKRAVKPEYHAVVERVFEARGGFGCSPTAGGSAVFGTFLVDGENARFSRGDVERLATDEEVAEARAEATRRQP
jgi:hypothetical protein